MPRPGKASVLINKASRYFQLIGITQLRAVLICTQWKGSKIEWLSEACAIKILQDKLNLQF